nr:hypothetical protein HK105_002650 [Polyrhizophydium stewartii]
MRRGSASMASTGEAAAQQHHISMQESMQHGHGAIAALTLQQQQQQQQHKRMQPGRKMSNEARSSASLVFATRQASNNGQTHGPGHGASGAGAGGGGGGEGTKMSTVSLTRVPTDPDSSGLSHSINGGTLGVFASSGGAAAAAGSSGGPGAPPPRGIGGGLSAFSPAQLLMRGVSASSRASVESATVSSAAQAVPEPTAHLWQTISERTLPVFSGHGLRGTIEEINVLVA